MRVRKHSKHSRRRDIASCVYSNRKATQILRPPHGSPLPHKTRVANAQMRRPMVYLRLSFSPHPHILPISLPQKFRPVPPCSPHVTTSKNREIAQPEHRHNKARKPHAASTMRPALPRRTWSFLTMFPPIHEDLETCHPPDTSRSACVIIATSDCSTKIHTLNENKHGQHDFEPASCKHGVAITAIRVYFRVWPSVSQYSQTAATSSAELVMSRRLVPSTESAPFMSHRPSILPSHKHVKIATCSSPRGNDKHSSALEGKVSVRARNPSIL